MKIFVPRNKNKIYLKIIITLQNYIPNTNSSKQKNYFLQKSIQICNKFKIITYIRNYQFVVEGSKEYIKEKAKQYHHRQKRRWSITSVRSLSSEFTPTTITISSSYSRRVRKYYKSIIEMRTKRFIVILCCVVASTLLFIVLTTAGESNDSLKNIVSQTHQQLNKLQENLRASEQKTLEIDPKYLALLGFTTSTSSLPLSSSSSSLSHPTKNSESQYDKNETDQKSKKPHTNGDIPGFVEEIQHLPLQRDQDNNNNNNKLHAKTGHAHTTQSFNGTKANFSIVTYVQEGQAPSAILLSQNIALKFPTEYLLIYDLGLSEEDLRALSAYCNSSRCTVISYDLSVYPSYVADQRMHAYRPIVIKDALMRSKSILFAENYMRIRGSSRDLYNLQRKVSKSGVLGWNTPTAVSTRTHPKMFDYFQTDAEDFIFLRMVDLDTVLFDDTVNLTKKILLSWIKCALTLECIDPIGAQSNGCKYNKKPQYRYSGCHSYDTSAFNIVLGLTFHLDDTKYSLPSESNYIFKKETLEQATKILENRRRNSSETSEHPFTDE